MRSIACIALGCLVLSAFGQDPPKQDKPTIKKVVLYKHGVGYFERAGKVKGDQAVTLSFKAAQMKDLLTSLFAVDLSGGKVEGISYDSKDPIEKQLENILIRVPEGSAMTQFLSQLKGARIEIKVGNDSIKGSVMGIEPFQQKVENTVITHYKLVMLKEDGQIQQTSLNDVASLKLLDESLQEDLKRLLDIHMKSKYADRKEVKIAFKGQGERDVVIGYLIETPIWKTTYRLIFAADKPQLQGWAIVDNPTDEDWDNVELTMVAGNPLSFILDLYTPHYPQRPIIGLESVRPQSEAYDAANDAPGDKVRKEFGARGGAERFREEAKKAMDPAAAPAPRPNMGEMMSRSIDPIVQGAPVGELFAYSSKGPVSVPRGKAALIPIIAEKVEGERVQYYRYGGRVMNSFYMKNSSQLTLEGGPVTTFEGSTSLGEGLIRRELKPGMKEMISYAIEAGVRVERASDHKQRPLHRMTLANGILNMTYFQLMETEYKIHNETGKKQVMYLDHPKTGGYKLLEPAKPEEELPEAYRLKVEITDKLTSVKLVERIEISSGVYIQNAGMDQIRVWLEQPALSEKAKKFLEEVLAHQTELARLARDQNGMQTEYNQLAQDEGRYRSNLSVLGTSVKEREMRDKYLDKLGKIDERMGELRTQMQANEQKRRELEQALSKKVMDFKE